MNGNILRGAFNSITKRRRLNKTMQKEEKLFNVDKQLNSTAAETKAMENKSNDRRKARRKRSLKSYSYYKPASHPLSLVS
jgi:hypothetical protein